ncbi:sodium:solute symporter family protein [Salinicola corii]|uniref:Sodium:solute symporter family protein n=1 Tax=Salinicola corii TaxID=2606937 RepID=A0A640WFR0_9GAMM|nr:sodium:solute symporter family protein [Salinicola corii]KAA0019094.1 sodium:solute symporter family protein [Salinicola corii]
MFDATERWILGVVVAVCFFLLIGYAAYFYRLTKTYADYNLAGRSASLFPMILTIVGTAIGGSVLLGAMSQGYVGGLGQIWLPGSFTVTSILLAVFFLRRIREVGEQHDMVSIADFTALRFGDRARIPTIVSILCAYCAITGMQFVAIASILHLVFGLSVTAGILIAWLLLTLKTYLGGLKAVIWSDAVLGTLQTVAVIVLLAVVYLRLGGWGEIERLAAAGGQRDMLQFGGITLQELAVLFLTIGAYQFVRQDLWQRIWAAKSLATIRWAYWIGLTVAFLTGAVVVVLGVLAAIGLDLDLADPGLVYYAIIQEVLPLPLVALMIVALLSTVISCADSFFIAGASSIANDIIRPRLKRTDERTLLRYSRLSVVLMSLIALALALYLPNLVQMWILGSAMLVSGLLAPVLAALIWPRLSPRAGLASMWIGLLTALLWQVAGQPLGWHPVFIGLPVSILVLAAGSLIAARAAAPVRAT